MTDFKDQMIEAIERGVANDDDAYEIVREGLADAADSMRRLAKEGLTQEQIDAAADGVRTLAEESC